MDQISEYEVQTPDNPHKQWSLRHYDELLKQLENKQMTREEYLQKLSEEREILEQKASHDGLLKNFYTNSVFTEQLEQQIAITRRNPEMAGVLAALDVDEFKRFNDTFSHPEGDRLLKIYARVIEEQTREVDVWGRVGGDELTVYMPATDIVDAQKVAMRLLDAFQRGIREEFPNLPWEQKISIGLSSALEKDTPKDLRGRADQALYEAKERGGIIINQ